MLKGFKDFILRGNIVDLAVAVVMGAAFTAVVSSFTDSFLRPLIGLVGGGGVTGGSVEVDGQLFTIGAFVNEVVTFVITGAVVYAVVLVPMRRLVERRSAGDEPGPVVPTQTELLVEIRDLLRAQQGQAPAPEPEARHRA